MGDVIYEKKYPKENLEEIMSPSENEDFSDNHTLPPFEEFLEKMYANRFSVPIPARMEAAEYFIQTAREISELYELDVTITKHFDHISVDYYFDAAGCMGFLRDVVKYADEISFFANIMGYEIGLCLDFYTHAVFQGGRQIRP